MIALNIFVSGELLLLELIPFHFIAMPMSLLSLLRYLFSL